MMYKGFWFQQKCSAAGSRVDCYSDTVRKRACSKCFSPGMANLCRSHEQDRKRERVKRVVLECVCICVTARFQVFFKGKRASKPSGTVPQKILKEARWKPTLWQPGSSCEQDKTSCLCRLIIKDIVQKNSLYAPLELHSGSDTSLLNNSWCRCVSAPSLHIGK